jgi:hypothetical protein
LRAPIDTVKEAAPGEVSVSVYESFAATAIRRDAREPLVKLHAGDEALLEQGSVYTSSVDRYK